MKKLLPSLALAFFALLNVNAQETDTDSKGFAQGDVYVSGTVSYSKTTISDFDVEVSEFTFSPSAGFFVSDHIALELSLLVGSSKEVEFLDEYEYNSIGGGLGAVYFFTPNNKFSFTTGAAFQYTNFKSEINGIESDDSTNSYRISLNPGVNYFISEAFALRGSIGALSYASRKSTAEGAPTYNFFDLNLDLSNVNLGLTYKF